VARPFAVDGVPVALAEESKLDRASSSPSRSPKILVQAGERVGMLGLMRPTGKPQRPGQDGERDRARRPSSRACRRRSRRPRSSEIVVVSDFWADGRAAKTRAAHRPPVHMAAPSCRSSTRRKRPFLFRPGRVHRDGRRRIDHRRRAEAWKSEYEQLAPPARQFRAETDKLGWSFTIHRTDRLATELLLALHARLGAPPPGAMIASRSGLARQPARPA
jgi:hypothetical protein